MWTILANKQQEDIDLAISQVFQKFFLSQEQLKVSSQNTSINHTAVLIYPGLYLTLVGLV